MTKLKQLLLLLTLFVLVQSISLAISVNDGIYATANLNVRQTASTTGTLIGTVTTNTVGNVIGGPTVSGGFTWWQITWGSPFITGWSVQDFLGTVPPSPTVFSEFLSAGWHVYPWANMSSLLTSTTRRSGTYGIQAISSAAYARLYIQTTIGFNTSGQQTLRFSMMSPSGSGQNHYVGIYNTSGSVIQYLPIWNYVSGNTLVPNTWYDIVVPLSDLLATNQVIGGVVIEIESAGTFYADEISFSTVSGSTYWTPPPPTSTITSVSASCSPSSVQVNNGSQCTASVSGTGSYNSAVTWSANAGTINSSGFFTAPSSVPSPAGVTITAQSVQDTSKVETSTVTVTAVPVQFTQASNIVFGDSIGNGWYIGSWPQVVTDPASDTAYLGDNGVQVQIATPNYGRLQILAWQNYKFNTANYNYLSFVINIGKYETEDLYVGLINSSGAVIQYVSLKNYTASLTLDAYRWQVVNIPLSALGIVSATDIYGIEIQSTNPATFTVDEINFKGACI